MVPILHGFSPPVFYGTCFWATIRCFAALLLVRLHTVAKECFAGLQSVHENIVTDRSLTTTWRREFHLLPVHSNPSAGGHVCQSAVRQLAVRNSPNNLGCGLVCGEVLRPGPLLTATPRTVHPSSGGIDTGGHRRIVVCTQEINHFTATRCSHEK